MAKLVRAAVLAVVAVGGMTALAAAQKGKDAPRGERLKTVVDATAEFDKDRKTLTITAVGQVPTGGWGGAKLTPKATKDAPKDGIYEFELTAVRPGGIVTQVISKVKATYTWEKVPADLKGVRILGSEKGAKTVAVGK